MGSDKQARSKPKKNRLSPNKKSRKAASDDDSMDFVGSEVPPTKKARPIRILPSNSKGQNAARPAGDDGMIDSTSSEDEFLPTKFEKKARSKRKGNRRLLSNNEKRKAAAAIPSIQDETTELLEYINEIYHKMPESEEEYEEAASVDSSTDDSIVVTNEVSRSLSDDDGSERSSSEYTDSGSNSSDSVVSCSSQSDKKTHSKRKGTRKLSRNKGGNAAASVDEDGLVDDSTSEDEFRPVKFEKKTRSKRKGKHPLSSKQKRKAVTTVPSIQHEGRESQEYTDQIDRKMPESEEEYEEDTDNTFTNEVSGSLSDDESKKSFSGYTDSDGNSTDSDGSKPEKKARSKRKGKRLLSSNSGKKPAASSDEDELVDSTSEEEFRPTKFQKKARSKRKGKRIVLSNMKRKAAAADGLVDTSASQDEADNQSVQSIQDEVRDLLEYTNEINRTPKTKEEYEEDAAGAAKIDSAQQEDLAHMPPVNPVCKKCKHNTEMGFSQKRDKHYFMCPQRKCGYFLWIDNPEVMSQLPSGPLCECGRPSAAIRDGKGTPLWVCANTDVRDLKHCNFEVVIGEEPDSANTDINRKPSRPMKANSDSQFIVGGESLHRLQQLFEVSAEESHEIYDGVDYRSSEPNGYYDNFEVVRAWKIAAPPSSVESFYEFRQQVEDVQDTVELRTEYAKACHDLVEGEKQLAPLHSNKNEKLLLHGTKPSVVASILETSLDPKKALFGLFGKGTYFAENPIKINQYVKEDAEWKGGERERRHGTICGLHNKLYPRPDMHPGNVFYALVCRVVLGNPDRTKHRKSKPAEGHHSILAGLNGDLKRYREFVVFDKRAVNIEYLVAYQRVRSYCYCKSPARVRKRTIASQDHRPCIACDNSRYNVQSRRYEGGCGFFAALPRCYCENRKGNDFVTAPTEVGKNRFYCGRCGFHRWIKQGVDLREAEDSPDDDEDEYDLNDGFLVEG